MKTFTCTAALIAALNTLSHVSAQGAVTDYTTVLHTVVGQGPTVTSTLPAVTITEGQPPPSPETTQPSTTASTPSTTPSSVPSEPPPSQTPPSQTPSQTPSSTTPLPSSTPADPVVHNLMAKPVQNQPKSSPTTLATQPSPSSTQARPTTTVPTSAVTQPPVAGNGIMTIKIENHWPEPLSLSYEDNAGSPGALGSPTPALLGTATSIVYPTNWAGRIHVGKVNHKDNSKIEGSTTGWNDIDVSYVDGYSVPITCSAHGEPVTGCNIDLWAVSGKCDKEFGKKAVCTNPMQDVANGPSVPWFLPCQGSAYTFPNDNVANNGDIRGTTTTCCIGTEEMGCKAPERQGKGDNRPSKAKRSLPSVAEQPLAFSETVEEAKAQEMALKPHGAAHSHSHLKRHLSKRKAHGHAHPRELKEVV